MLGGDDDVVLHVAEVGDVGGQGRDDDPNHRQQSVGEQGRGAEEAASDG
jgi:hypothetical protein